jgi:hypothetical protein
MNCRYRSAFGAVLVVAFLFGRCPAPADGAPTADSAGAAAAGEGAPDFTLFGADGRGPVRLSDLRGKPGVLLFGSCTCPLFRRAVPEIQALSAAFRDRAHVYVIYIREAHPIAGRPSPEDDLPPVPPGPRDFLLVSVGCAIFLGLLCGAGLVLALFHRKLGRRGVVLVVLLTGAGLTAYGTALVMNGPRNVPIVPGLDAVPTRAPFDPRTQQERDEAARYFTSQFKVAQPVLVDTLDDTVGQAYAAMPERIYVIDAGGKVAYQGEPGPGGFSVSEVPPVLDQLLGDPPHSWSR